MKRLLRGSALFIGERYAKGQRDDYIESTVEKAFEEKQKTILEDDNIKDLLTSKPPPREFLIDEILPMKARAAMLVGPGGASKTMFALQVGIAIATGSDLFDWGDWCVENPGQVMLITAEDDRDEIHTRLHAVLDHFLYWMRDDGGFLQRLESNLFIATTVAQDNLLVKAGERTGYEETILERAKKHNLKLLILDPLSRFYGGDFNDNAQAVRFVEVLEYLASALNCMILVTHHTSKFAAQSDQQSAQHAALGGTMLTNSVRLQMNIGPMTTTQAEQCKIPESERLNWLNFGTSKTNYSSPKTGLWLYRDPRSGVLSVSRPGVSVLKRIAALVESEAKAGREYSKSAFVDEFREEFKASRRDFERLIKNAIAEDLLIIGAPSEPEKGVKAVLKVVE
jgi:RecA-family ATPase